MCISRGTAELGPAQEQLRASKDAAQARDESFREKLADLSEAKRQVGHGMLLKKHGWANLGIKTPVSCKCFPT